MSRDDGAGLREHRSYRHRRTIDAARLLPLIGLFLFVIPVLAAGGRDTVSTVGGVVYVFFIWGILIVVSAFLALRLGNDNAGDEGPPSE